MFVPSKYQQDIFNVIQKESCNLVVSSTAGSGKSTTILESTKLLPDGKRVILVAFNKSIAEELGKKVKEGVKTSTLHALGYAIIKRNNSKAKMNGDKVYDYIDKRKNKWLIPKDKIAFFNRIKRMVDLGRLNWRPGFCEEDMDLVAANYGIDNFDNESECAWEIFDLVADDTKQFDFPDMIFMPVKNNYKFLTYDIVFGDEIQDFSSLERDFFLRLINSNGRFIGVGDENQAIYGFKGSSSESFRVLAAQPNTKILPLSISYRCSQAVTKWANELVPEMEFRPGAPMGSVVFNGSIKNIQKNDVVLCRLNFPLVSLALEFIQKGVPVIIQGKDIGRSLIVLMQSYKSDSNQDLILKLQNKLKKLIEKLKKKNPSKDPEIDPQVCAFSDKLSIVKILLNKY
jgi:superfamily I DNA/RNA helicase